MLLPLSLPISVSLCLYLNSRLLTHYKTQKKTKKKNKTQNYTGKEAFSHKRHKKRTHIFYRGTKQSQKHINTQPDIGRCAKRCTGPRQYHPLPVRAVRKWKRNPAASLWKSSRAGSSSLSETTFDPSAKYAARTVRWGYRVSPRGREELAKPNWNMAPGAIFYPA